MTFLIADRILDRPKTPDLRPASHWLRASTDRWAEAMSYRCPWASHRASPCAAPPAAPADSGSSRRPIRRRSAVPRSEEHTSELQSRVDLVCRLLLEKKKQTLRAIYA